MISHLTLARTVFTTSLVAVFVVAGCRSVNTVEREQPRSTPNYVDPRIDISDSSLNKAVQIVDVREAMAGDLRKIQVELRNTTNDTKHFQYRFDWLDEQGMTIRSTMSGWTTRTILPKEQISVSAVAPSPGAEDFRLKLLESK